jgi:hypothetical protein
METCRFQTPIYPGWMSYTPPISRNGPETRSTESRPSRKQIVSWIAKPLSRYPKVAGFRAACNSSTIARRSYRQVSGGSEVQW